MAQLPALGMERISLLPTPKEWLKGTSVTGVIRKRSKITEVDNKLQEVWKAFDAARNLEGENPENEKLKKTVILKLVTLQSAIDAYLKYKGFTGREITIQFDFDFEQLAQSDDRKVKDLFHPWKPYIGDVKRKNREKIEEIRRRAKNSRFKDQRIMAALALRRLVTEERVRLHYQWKQASIPRVDANLFWQGYTLVPTLKLWKIDSTGGSDRRWTPRSKSRIRHIDNALENWWDSFQWANRDETLKGFEKIELEIAKYLDHKDRPGAAPNVREHSVLLLLDKIRFEKERLEEEWIDLLPPRRISPERLAQKAGSTVPMGEESMELRTLLPTLEAWKKRSSLRGHIRSRSSIKYVDNVLAEFWGAFRPNGKNDSIEALENLKWELTVYDLYQSIKTDNNSKPKKRHNHAIWLKDVCEEELVRLSVEWKKGDPVPPDVLDEEPPLPENLLKEANVDVSRLASQVKVDHLDALDKESGLREKDMAIDTIPGEEAARRLLRRYKSGRKNRKQLMNEIAMIQATGIVNYREAARKRAMEDKHDNVIDTYDEILVEVVSYADAMAQNIMDAQANSSAYLTTAGLGEMVSAVNMSVFGIARMVTAVKAEGWKKAWSKTNKGKLVFDLTKFSIHVGNTIEKYPHIIKMMVEGSTSANKPVDMGLNFVNSAGDAVSVFDMGAVGLGLVTNTIELGKNIHEHRGLTRVIERFSALHEIHPELALVVDTSPAFRSLQLSLMGKLGRRQTRSRIGGAQALVGIGAAIVGIGATAGLLAATAWNPVGWALVGVGALMTIGFFTYKGVRRYQQHQKLKDARLAYDIPPWINTFGEWERFQTADLMFRSAIHDPHMSIQLKNVGYGLMFVLMGGDLKECCSEVRKMGHQGVMAFIKG